MCNIRIIRKRSCGVLMLLAAVGAAIEARAEMQASELDKIVVSATKTPHTLGDVPVDAEVITREELLQRNVQTAQQALEQTTGLYIGKNSNGWGSKGTVGMYGLVAKYSLVLVDGQRLLGGHQNAIDLQQISVEMIERIEILKGLPRRSTAVMPSVAWSTSLPAKALTSWSFQDRWRWGRAERRLARSPAERAAKS